MLLKQSPRLPWGDFPLIHIVTDQSAVKQHPEFADAKTGDVSAAKRLAAALTDAATLNAIGAFAAGRHPVLAPVHAIEDQGINRIPVAFAELLAERLHFDVDADIIQGNIVSHTGATGWERMARPPVFDGAVHSGKNYLLVDDFVGQGGTLANLRGYILQGGGRVLGACTLTGRADSATLALRPQTLIELRAKHGKELENWWRKIFGYDFDRLTESEARYLIRAEDPDTIRARLAAAGSPAEH